MFHAIIAVVIFLLLPIVLRILAPLIPILFVISAVIAIFSVGTFLLPYIAGILGIYGFFLAIKNKIGGGDGLDNLQCLCKHCNRSKQDSLRDTVPDYARNNVERARRKIFD